MTKEEREMQLRKSKFNLLYGIFICFILWILLSTIDVWLMRLDYTDTGIKREIGSWNFYNLLPEEGGEVYESE